MEIYLKFGGFYNSEYSGIIDLIEENQLPMDEEGNVDFEASPEQAIDYEKAHNIISKEIIKAFNENFEVDAKFVKLVSPREYNFSTDKILVEISELDLTKIIKEVHSNKDLLNDFNELVENYTTRRDGYVPYYTEEEVRGDISKIAEYAIKAWFDRYGTNEFIQEYGDIVDKISNLDIYVDSSEPTNELTNR